jgi:hypothetical protein
MADPPMLVSTLVAALVLSGVARHTYHEDRQMNP